MSREAQVRFCESRAVRSRPATHLVVHCATERQAREVLAALAVRMEEVGLRLHPDKTKIVYCKDDRRRGSFEHTSFTFLGFTFRCRGARRKDGRMFNSFLPAVSPEALTAMGREVRRWRMHLWVNRGLSELAEQINPRGIVKTCGLSECC